MEILLDSPFLLIILIGLISSIFKRMKGNAVDAQNPRPARPVRMPATSESNHMPAGSSTATQTNIQQLYQETKQRGLKVPEEAESRGARVRRIGDNPQPAAQSSERSNDFQPSRNSLVDGIIWSEVLGPPRSKKPYRSGRRN